MVYLNDFFLKFGSEDLRGFAVSLIIRDLKFLLMSV